MTVMLRFLILHLKTVDGFNKTATYLQNKYLKNLQIQKIREEYKSSIVSKR